MEAENSQAAGAAGAESDVSNRKKEPTGRLPDDAKRGSAVRGVALNSSLEKGLRVLQVFVEVDQPLRLKDIAELTGLQASAAQRLVYTLHKAGMLQRDERTRMYSLARKVLDFGYAYLRQDPLLARATPYLFEANQRCGETISLIEMDDVNVVYIARVPSRYGVSADVILGSWFPAFACAGGQAVLAFKPEAEARQILSRSHLVHHTRNTVTDLDALIELFRSVRRQGFACSQEHYTPGDISIAAPILDSSGQAFASINISVPTNRWTKEAAEERLGPIAMETAAAISGHHSRPSDLSAVARTGPQPRRWQR